jgi:hypothetical protein
MATPMKLHNLNVQDFITEVEHCKGNVYLVTNDGDKLNLKSKLCQIVGLTAIIEGGKIAEAEVVCDSLEDESKLFRFNLYGKK